MTSPYPECPCYTCSHKGFKTRKEMVNGLLVSIRFPFCIEKSLDITGRTGPCRKYDGVI